MIEVRPVVPGDVQLWLEMRRALWPDGSKAEHEEEIRQFFAGEFPRGPWAVLVAQDESGPPLGFAELGIRAYAEGCVTTRVAYLEGWFVMPEARGRGVGAALIRAAEGWGRSQGCSEFASDTEVDNELSAAAHKALGFEDLGLVRCFRKSL